MYNLFGTAMDYAKMKIMGIEFAPLNIPLQRRLQTVAAACWFVVMAFGGFMGMSVSLYLLFTRFWFIILLYLGWAWIIDGKTCDRGGRRIDSVRHWAWWSYFRDYFPLRLERVPWVELDPNKNYLFCYFPHGMLSCGAFSAFGAPCMSLELFPNHKPHVITLKQHFSMPFFRELALSLGGCSASAESIAYILSKKGGGNLAVLMVGGAAEAYNCKPGQYRFVVRNRKGFVRLALQNGTPLVPVIGFGENDLFTQFDSSKGTWLRTFQECLRKIIGFAPIVPLGRGFFQYSFGIIPHRKPVTTVVGKPLEVPKLENPTKDQINEYHTQFVDKLYELFEEQKYNYLSDPDNVHLELE